MNEGLYASWLGLSGIPREAETVMLERDLRGGLVGRHPLNGDALTEAEAGGACTIMHS